MAVLAGVPRNATVTAPEDGGPVTILEMVRPALRLLRSLKEFAEQVDTTYREHGIKNTITKLQEDAGAGLGAAELTAIGTLGQFIAYSKHHVLAQEGTPVDKLILYRIGYVRPVSGEPIFLNTMYENGRSGFVAEACLA